MTRLIAVLGFLLMAEAAWADEAVTADHAASGDEIVLSDGRVLRLAGIKGFDGAQAFLQNKIAGKTLTLQNAEGDRYGRLVAVASVTGDKETLEDDVLSEGLGFVYPTTGDVDRWLVEEKTARLAGRGDWKNHADVSADEAEKLYGQYGFVSGTVVKAERVKNKVYLNFGADWKTDFTIAIAAHDLRAFKNADIDLLALAGKRVRVRGWVKRDFGPMITITDPHQLEILN